MSAYATATSFRRLSVRSGGSDASLTDMLADLTVSRSGASTVLLCADAMPQSKEICCGHPIRLSNGAREARV